jgi:IS5 family transposase
MISKNMYLRFIDEALQLAKLIPKYFSKFSNKIYSNHQKIVLLVLKQKLKITYRDLIEWLAVTTEIKLVIGLTRIPHHSTLVKFAKKLSTSLLNCLLNIKQAGIVAVDATGFETETKSYYYRNAYHNKQKKKARRYDKLSIAIDTDKQIILSHKIRKGPRNDNIDFKTLLKDLSIRHYVVADKGYDSKENRKYVLQKKTYPHIPYRRTSASYERIGKKIKFDESVYHQRSKVETAFSVIKRKYGSVVKGRSFESQKKEIICKLIAYNIDRKIKICLLIIGFQQSPIILS